jgi:hypothetical protein
MMSIILPLVLYPKSSFYSKSYRLELELIPAIKKAECWTLEKTVAYPFIVKILSPLRRVELQYWVLVTR